MESKMEIGKQSCGVEVDGGKWRQEGNGNGEKDGDWKVELWSGGRRRQVETGRKWKLRARWRLESKVVDWRQTEASGDRKEMEMESKMEIGKQMC